MKRVTGIGGVFFKAKNPEQLGAWYQKHLGVNLEEGGVFSVFHWREKDDPERAGATVWSIFPQDSTYFGQVDAPLMINYRVENLDALLKVLKEEGVNIVGGPDDTELGRFAWILDAEGNRIELWEAPKA